MRIIEDLVSDWRRPDERIEGLSADIISLMEKNPACERLMTVPGIGPIISSAMVAATGGRDLFSAAGISLPGRGWRRGRSSRTLGFERSSDISFQRRAASQWQVFSSSRAGGSRVSLRPTRPVQAGRENTPRSRVSVLAVRPRADHAKPAGVRSTPQCLGALALAELLP